MFGLIERDLSYISRALKQFDEIERSVIFGSRAMGNYKKGSDVDIAIIGKDVSSNTLFKVHELLNEEYPLPYFFDILNYHEITNEQLKAHIDAEGKEVYRKGN